MREQRSLLRGINLRNNSHILPRSSFISRRTYLVTAFKEGKLLAEPSKKGQPKANPLTDPSQMEGMMGMMKGNVAMMVPQTLIMGWVNAFFSGYVLRKLTAIRVLRFSQDIRPLRRGSGLCLAGLRGNWV